MGKFASVDYVIKPDERHFGAVKRAENAGAAKNEWQTWVYDIAKDDERHSGPQFCIFTRPALGAEILDPLCIHLYPMGPV